MFRVVARISSLGVAYQTIILSVRQRSPSTRIEKLAVMSSDSGGYHPRALTFANLLAHLTIFREIPSRVVAGMASQATVTEADVEIIKPPPARTLMDHVESIL